MSPLLIPIGTMGATKEKLQPYWLSIANWSKTVEKYEFAQDVEIDASGNSYLSGVDSDTVGNMLFIKYDPLGQPIWQKQFFQNGQEAYANAFSSDSAGGFYAGGCARVASGGKLYATVVKLDSFGSIVWQKNIGDGIQDYNNFYSKVIDTDNSGNSYTTSHTRIYPPENPNASYTVTYLHKLNSSGALQWQRRLMHPSNTSVNLTDVAVHKANGNVYVGGSHDNGGFTSSRATVAQFNSSGAFQWTRELSANGSGYSSVTAINTTAAGDVIVMGYYYETSIEPFIAKFNSSGTLLWQRTTTNVFIRYMEEDAAGNLYFSGYDGVDYVAALFKYNSSGTLIWQRRILNFKFRTMTAFRVNSNNDIFLSGSGIVGLYDNAMTLVKLPGDGSLLGTFGPITYVAGSFTESSYSRSWITSSTYSVTATVPISDGAHTGENISLVYDRKNIK